MLMMETDKTDLCQMDITMETTKCASITEKRNIQEMHSYACVSNSGEECISSPNTPQKHIAKKSKNSRSDSQDQPSLYELQNTIISAVIEKINERADKTDQAVHYNTVQIDGLKKSLDFCHQEVVDLKNQHVALKNKCDLLQKKVNEMEQKVNESDRYSRRHNLRLHGVSEKGDTQVRSQVRDICRAVLPAEEAEMVVAAVDVAHRIGRPKEGGQDQPPRPVIIKFISRTARDVLWKGSKANNYLKNNRLHFKEDLTAADRATRSRLWPMVEAARKKGDKAYFVGDRAYVNGKEIK